MSDPQAPLKEFQPRHDFFVGIDSDGCVFDSMEIKHKECFIPNTVKHWNLQPVSKYARRAAEFVNLYSKWRGTNRFPALLMVFDLLEDWPEVQARGAEIPGAASLRKWVANEPKPAEPALKKAVDATKDSVLEQTYAWSRAVNETIDDLVKGVPPFPSVRGTLDKIIEAADMIVVSATPDEALQREWAENGITEYAAVIAGQEMGKKAEHLELVTKGKYESGRVLMIGDGPGDLRAARANDALFYPVNPEGEEESWQRLRDESFDRFLEGSYAGEYEASLIAEFEALLPEIPPWK